MPGPLTGKLEVVRLGMDLNDIFKDKFRGVLHYEDKPYAFCGYCQASKNLVMFYDPLRGLYANHNFEDLAAYMNNNPGKNFRNWLESLLINGKYGCNMYMGYSDDFYNELGETQITHILD